MHQITKKERTASRIVSTTMTKILWILSINQDLTKKKSSDNDANAALLQTLEKINNPLPRSRLQTSTHGFLDISERDQLFSKILIIELGKFPPRKKLELKAKITVFGSTNY